MKGYEKQLQWRQVTAAKAAAKKQEEVHQDQPSFTPQLFSVPVKEFEGSARDLAERSAYQHITRQEKARLEKKKTEDRVSWQPKGSNKPTAPPPPPEIPSVYLSHESDGDEHLDGHRRSSRHADAIEVEAIVEMLERERKEWSEERAKLVQCIQLQQLELAQRATAAHERAVEIATEFARAIEGFEERLVLVETNVQKEILAVKLIAESLRVAIASNPAATAHMSTAMAMAAAGGGGGPAPATSATGTSSTAAQASSVAR